MENNIDMINFIQQNAEKKKDTLKKLIDTVDDKNFAAILAAQYDQYNDIYKKCEVKIQDSNLNVKEVSPFSKAANSLMLNIKTMNDKSPSRIAEILIEDGTEGIIDIKKRIKETGEIPQDIRDLTDNLLKTEEGSLENMKRYL